MAITVFNYFNFVVVNIIILLDSFHFIIKKYNYMYNFHYYHFIFKSIVILYSNFIDFVNNFIKIKCFLENIIFYHIPFILCNFIYFFINSI